MVSVTMMTAIPALNQASREQQLDQAWLRATPFSISFSKLSSGNLSFSIENKAKKTVVLTGIELGTDTQVVPFWVPDSSQSFRPGQEIVIANESFNVSGNPCNGQPVGTYYEFKNITLTYTEGSISGIRQMGGGIAGYCSGTDLVSPMAGAYPGYAQLSGYVRNLSGTGLASASIIITNGEAQQSTTTNSIGYYQINVSLGNETALVAANASYGSTYNYSATSLTLITEYPVTLDFVVALQPGTNYAMFVRDTSGSNVAAFTTAGHLMLKGGCYSGASCATPPDGSLAVRDSSGVTHAYINSSGSLCVEDSDCNYFDSSCNDAPDGSLVLRSPAGANITYISPAGVLCTTGEIWQYGTP